MNALSRDEEKDKVKSTETYTSEEDKGWKLFDRFGQLLMPVIKHCRKSRHFTSLDCSSFSGQQVLFVAINIWGESIS